VIANRQDAGQRVYLHPGQMALGSDDHSITTILGSCVAVCLYDTVQRIGGLNHFLLPHAPTGQNSTRYGDVAMRRLLDEMMMRGSQFRHLQATVIGGACVLPANQGRAADLGRANARVALGILGAAGIPVVMEDLGGQRGRRVLFHTGSGDVLVRQL